MPGNPVRRKPEIVDLDAPALIPGGMTRREELEEGRRYRAAMEAYLATMPKGDILDVIRTPFNVIGNSMAGLGAEMLGKSKDFEKYAYTPKTQAEMKALEAMMAVMGPPMELMDYLKIPPIGPGLPTLAGAMRGVDTAAVRLSQKQAAEAARRAGQAVKNAATSDDMAYAIENFLKKTGHGPMEIMVGPKSKTFRHDAAALAEQMEKEGKNRNEIWKATRTVRAPDNQWKQELSDLNMKYSASPVRSRQYETDRKRYSQAIDKATTQDELQAAQKYYEKQRGINSLNFIGKAQEFIEHPELFQAYPELANYAFRELEPTHKKFTAPQNAYGFYSPGQKTVTVNTDAPFKRSTALHELQHAIQEIEGWQGGSSPEEMALKIFQRDQAKDDVRILERSVNGMRSSDPVKYASQIQVEEQMLKKAQDELNKTKQLEGETDPYDAYRKVSGEEEARMVQARRDYPEEKLAERPPFLDYEAKPWEHITEFAAGGEVHMNKGGVLGRVIKTAEKGMERAMQGALPQVNRIDMHYKDVGKRVPELTEAAQRVARGEATAADYDTVVNKFKPVAPYSFVPAPATVEDAMRALDKNKRLMYGKTTEIQPGEIADLRLDIPAYQNHGVWINSIHRNKQPTVYGSISSVKNARMFGAPEKAFRVATGEAQKGPWATISGEWNPMDEATAVKNAQQYLTHEDWRQVGYDPERHGYFYDRHTMEPVTGAEEVLQIGPLVLAKKPIYGVKAEQKFAEGGVTIDEFLKRMKEK
jgi:hypothetical protein